MPQPGRAVLPARPAAAPGRSTADLLGPRPGSRPPAPGLDLRQLAGLAAVLAVLWLTWHTWLVYPLKILVVFFHELSHGLAAMATGGKIAGIEVVAREGGFCRTLGGNRFLTLSAGYLGSLVWGGLILVAAARSRFDQAITAGLGLLLLGSALLWVRPVFSFGFGFALAVGVALILAGLYLPPSANDFLLKAVGLTSILYAVFDIQDDVLSRPHLLESDASLLADLTGLPTLFWGLLWMAVAVVAAIAFLSLAGRAAPARYTPAAVQPPSLGGST